MLVCVRLTLGVFPPPACSIRLFCCMQLPQVNARSPLLPSHLVTLVSCSIVPFGDVFPILLLVLIMLAPSLSRSHNGPRPPLHPSTLWDLLSFYRWASRSSPVSTHPTPCIITRSPPLLPCLVASVNCRVVPSGGVSSSLHLVLITPAHHLSPHNSLH